MSQGRATRVHAWKWTLALAVVAPSVTGCGMAPRRGGKPRDSQALAMPMISADAAGPKRDPLTTTSGYEVEVEPDSFPALPEAKSAPTPTLDRALVRSRAIQEQVARSVAFPGRTVAPTPTTAIVATEPPAELPTMPAPEPAVAQVAQVETKAAPPAPTQSKPEKPPEPTPEQAWAEALERLRSVARDPGESARNWALPVLDWLASPASQDETAGRIRSVIVGLLAQANSDPDPAAIRAAVDGLEAAAPLEMTDLRWCRNVFGFGDFDPIDEPTFNPGQSIILYCELSGVRSVEAEGQFRSKLQGQLAIVPDGGGEVAWSQTFDPAEDRCRRRRRDYFVNYAFSIPEALAPGTYRLRLTQTDQIAHRGATREIAFVVEPKAKPEPPAAAQAR